MSAEDRTQDYRRLALSSATRLLGTLDRSRFSPTAGSFDRDHWAWKFRDFPIVMLQTGILPVATLWAQPWRGNEYAGSERVLEWLRLALEQTLHRQRPNGAYDSVGPNTQDHGVTLAMAYILATSVQRIGAQVLGEDLTGRIRRAVRQACLYAARSSEDYAFIANHHALFALGWLRSGNLLDDDGLRTRGDDEIAQIIAQQSAEGWYNEYGGADPGYQSLGMSYLAQYQRERPLSALQESLGRAVRFMSYCVQLDGSVGGVVGSRLTSLWYPDGFESLGQSSELARAVAGAVASQLSRANVVTPESSDAQNLPTLALSYLQAANYASAQTAHTPDPATLPCETLRGMQPFPEAGLIVLGSDHYHGILQGRRGGVGVIHDRATRSVVFEDAGYVLESGTATWTSALSGEGNSVQVQDETEFRCQARMLRANLETLTPFRFLLLRMLNLTVFRLALLGRLTRRAVIRRMITGRTPGPFSLERTVTLQPRRVLIRDAFRRQGNATVASLFRARIFQPLHMGSARYFHQRDLANLSDTDCTTTAQRLNQSGNAVRSICIEFNGGTEPQTVSVTESDAELSALPDLAQPPQPLGPPLKRV